jgi:Cof subfamily protein (haloacid dehalogenase superfamily)
MDYRLIASDLDGTLLTPEHRLGEYSLRVLRALRDRGVHLVVASGRHYRDLRGLSGLLDGETCTISSNGAATYDGDGRPIAVRTIDPHCLDFLISDPAFGNVHTNLFNTRDWLVERPEPSLLVYHEHSGFSYRVTDFALLDRDRIIKVFYYGEPAELRDIQAYIREHCGELVSTTFSLPFTLEVMAEGVSKGAALERVCALRGIDRAATLAFGDGPNDVEMLRAAGLGVLVANADPKLKAALPGNPVIATNEDEAVARFLEQLFLEKS